MLNDENNAKDTHQEPRPTRRRVQFGPPPALLQADVVAVAGVVGKPSARRRSQQWRK
jgi:hypothetical protein